MDMVDKIKSVEEIIEDFEYDIWPSEYCGSDAHFKEIKDWLRTTLEAKEREAYTRGRIDEAKTCAGCQGRCEERVLRFIDTFTVSPSGSVLGQVLDEKESVMMKVCMEECKRMLKEAIVEI